jgi:hypothetical protein
MKDAKGHGSGAKSGAFSKMLDTIEAERLRIHKKHKTEPAPVFTPKKGSDAYEEGFAHAKRGIGRRQGMYDQKNYDSGYFAGRGTSK